MSSIPTPNEGGPCQTSNEELCAMALAHYDKISLLACEWNNQIPQAIRAWYAAKAQPSETAPLDPVTCGNCEGNGYDLEILGAHPNTVARRRCHVCNGTGTAPSASHPLVDGDLATQREIADRCASSAIGAPGWISVESDLPPSNTDNEYLIATRTGYVSTLFFTSDGWIGQEAEQDGYWNNMVTHWQSLPSAPSDGKADGS